MFGLGSGELLIVLILAVIFIGPDKLPSLASKLGRFVRQVQRTVDEIKSEFKEDDTK
ncbi:MAG TPA: twin-arginine translocase TatA/TatE family subunit [bacterium]|jgi:Tat protein translocase TatB subunit|nr:twin-arginine translocase TatA/TatE family subunit [bacterium]